MPPFVTMLSPQQNMKRQTPSVHHLKQSSVLKDIRGNTCCRNSYLHTPSVLPPQIRESVKEDSDNSLNSRELGAKAEGQEHHEEEDRPEGGDRHPRDGLRVGDESQPSSWMENAIIIRNRESFPPKTSLKIGGPRAVTP